MFAVSRPKPLSLSFLLRHGPRLGQVTPARKAASHQPQAAVRDRLVPGDLLAGRILLCVGLSATDLTRVRACAAALSGSVARFDTTADALNGLSRTALDPILIYAGDDAGMSPRKVEELRSQAPGTPLITLAAKIAVSRFGATENPAPDATLRTPLSATALQLALQAALANQSLHTPNHA